MLVVLAFFNGLIVFALTVVGTSTIMLFSFSEFQMEPQSKGTCHQEAQILTSCSISIGNNYKRSGLNSH